MFSQYQNLILFHKDETHHLTTYYPTVMRIISFFIIESMLTVKYASHFQTSLSRDTRLHRVSPRRNFPRIAPSKGLPSMENFRERRHGLHSDISLFAPRRDFSSSPAYTYSADLRATRTRTSRVVIWKKKIRSRGRWVTPWFIATAKKWIISHLSLACSLSNFYPFDSLRSTG